MAKAAALVIGAGPAGLMAAEALADAGWPVIVAESKPTPARKFLMAGKSGLNLTKDEPTERFHAAYPDRWIDPILAEFGPAQAMDWARGLGVTLFTGTTGRVFPVEMKASPLLRAWLARLASKGVEIRTRWRWIGFSGADFLFDTPEGQQTLRPPRTVLALGGASWPRLGSDAAWVPWLREKGVEIAPFRPANMGFLVDWSDHMRRHFGSPVKAIALIAGTRRERGEFVISARGIEGGGIYALSAQVRDGSPLSLDLLPDLTEPDIRSRLARPRGRDTMTNWLRKCLGLEPVKLALLREWAGPADDPTAIARLVKSLPVRHSGPRPISEAISSAGGVTPTALSPDLELRALPGVYACGEMLDWEAPTGGYLLTACLATGLWAGRAAAKGGLLPPS